MNSPIIFTTEQQEILDVLYKNYITPPTFTTASGTDTVTINASKGYATFTSTVAQGTEYTALTITNNLVTNETIIACGLSYSPNDTETCQISSYICIEDAIVFYMTNFSGVDAEQPKQIWFEILN